MTTARVSKEQIDYLCQFIRDHPLLVKGNWTRRYANKSTLDKLWNEAACELNARGQVQKDSGDWRAFWAELKYKAKRAINKNSADLPECYLNVLSVIGERELQDTCWPPNLRITKQVSQKQIVHLLSYMSEHPQLARPNKVNGEEQEIVDALWEELASQLNELEGCVKDQDKWRKVWKTLKCKAKARSALAKSDNKTSPRGGQNQVVQTKKEHSDNKGLPKKPPNTSQEQIDCLLQFMSDHPRLVVLDSRAVGAREAADALWEELASRLNALDGGCVKDADRWRSYWCEMKYKARIRVAQADNDNKTPLQYQNAGSVSDRDRKVLSIIGELDKVEAQNQVVHTKNKHPDNGAPPPKTYTSLISQQQIDCLLQFMSDHPRLVVDCRAVGARETADALWEELTSRLNAVDGGCVKDTAHWRSYWAEIKYMAKKRGAQSNNDKQTSPKNQIARSMTDRDRKILSILEELERSGAKNEVVQTKKEVPYNKAPPKKTSIASQQQVDCLLQFLSDHERLVDCRAVGAKETVDALWEKLANRLNALDGGCFKDAAHWRSYWAEIKCKARTKAAQANNDKHTSKNQITRSMSDRDLKVLSILGELESGGAKKELSDNKGQFKKRPQISQQQIDCILQFMSDHPRLAKSVDSRAIGSKETADALWEELASRLNALNDACVKDTAHWRNYWAEMKYKARTWAAQADNYNQSSAQNQIPGSVSDRSRKVLYIIGELDQAGAQGMKIKNELSDKKNPSKRKQFIRHASNRHRDCILQFMLDHPWLVNRSNIDGWEPHCKTTVDALWEELATQLNAIDDNWVKDKDNWRNYWNHVKVKARTRAARAKKDNNYYLPDYDQKVLSLIGELDAEGAENKGPEAMRGQQDTGCLPPRLPWSNKQVSEQQVEYILQFMSDHPQLAKSTGYKANYKQTVNSLWEKLSWELNVQDNGCVKDMDKWQEFWANMKHEARMSVLKAKKIFEDTGILTKVSAHDQKILAVIGEANVLEFGKLRAKKQNTEGCSCCGDTRKCCSLRGYVKNSGFKGTYADMISDCFGIDLIELEHNSSTELICVSCINKLKEAYGLKMQIKKRQGLFSENNVIIQDHFKEEEMDVEYLSEEIFVEDDPLNPSSSYSNLENLIDISSGHKMELVKEVEKILEKNNFTSEEDIPEYIVVNVDNKHTDTTDNKEAQHVLNKISMDDEIDHEDLEVEITVDETSIISEEGIQEYVVKNAEHGHTDKSDTESQESDDNTYDEEMYEEYIDEEMFLEDDEALANSSDTSTVQKNNFNNEEQINKIDKKYQLIKTNNKIETSTKSNTLPT